MLWRFTLTERMVLLCNPNRHIDAFALYRTSILALIAAVLSSFKQTTQFVLTPICARVLAVHVIHLPSIYSTITQRTVIDSDQFVVH